MLSGPKEALGDAGYLPPAPCPPRAPRSYRHYSNHSTCFPCFLSRHYSDENAVKMISMHGFPSAKSGSTIILVTFLLLGVYIVGLALYRLYFSPIAKFPGPKLAALSRWYEFYYEVVRKGQFTFRIQELHKQYGRSRFKSEVIEMFMSYRTNCPHHT
jgi:hypothetical protein